MLAEGTAAPEIDAERSVPGCGRNGTAGHPSAWANQNVLKRLTMSPLSFEVLHEGEQIHPARFPIVVGLLCCSIGCLLSIGFILAPESPRHPSMYPLLYRLAGILPLVGCGYGIYQTVQPWICRRRLVLGADRLQLIERDSILGQIPYDNISRIVVGQVGRSTAVLILLHDYHRPDTCWDNPPGFHGYLKSTTGFDLFIVEFNGSPEHLRKKILSRCGQSVASAAAVSRD
jgi:hypothetical protein